MTINGLLIIAPNVHFWVGQTNITNDGPALHFCVPRSAPPVGISRTGPDPLGGFAFWTERRKKNAYHQARKEDFRVSLVKSGIQTKGKIVLVIICFFAKGQYRLNI